jgi:hypothetical protein
MKYNYYFLLIATLILESCTQPPKINFTWLEGKWVQTNGDANFHEEWTIINDSLFEGRGYVVEGVDTLFSEKLKIKNDRERLYYCVEMVTGRIAEFKLTSEAPDKLIFELPENDFPSKIIYTKKSDNEMTVMLEGNENGKEIKDELLFSRQ